MNEKRCNKCGETKSASEFGLRVRNGKSYLMPRCKPCRYVEARKWRAANPDKVREHGKRWRTSNPDAVKRLKKLYRLHHPDRVKAQIKASLAKRWEDKYKPERWRKWLRTKYGITEEHFDDLVKKQHNKCAICKNGQSQGPRRREEATGTGDRRLFQGNRTGIERVARDGSDECG